MDITLWKLAMLALLPLMAMQQGKRPVHKIRVWLALFGASVAAWAVTPSVGHVPLLWYIAIDTMAGVIVMTRPAGVHQKAIGLLFAAMVCFHFGIWLRGTSGAVQSYYAFQIAAGWAQFFVLAAWSGHDVGKSIWNRFFGPLPVPAGATDIGAGR